MFSHRHAFVNTILFTTVLLSSSTICSSDDTSIWTGSCSSELLEYCNWNTDRAPINQTAIFNGNGAHSPMSSIPEGITFQQIEFTNATDVSIITRLLVLGSITSSKGTIGTFDIYEHQPLYYPPASMNIESGSAGTGAGQINYNLQGFGQLYAFTGADDTTTVNVTMTKDFNYFEIKASGLNVFDNINSDSETDEIVLFSDTTLVIKGSETNTIKGRIIGNGGLIKSGIGTLILDHNNIYTGDTEANQGTLIVNGTVPKNLLLAPGATLKGNGRVKGNLISSGNVSPGSSIGTLSVGNFFPDSSSVFICEINSSGLSDQLIATDSILLDGSLEIIPLDLSFSTPQTYQILQAGTAITGNFSTITTTVPALTALTYNTTDVSLKYLPLSALHLNSNATAALNCFTTLSSSDANEVSSNLLSLSTSQMQQAFNQMQPSQFSAETWTQLQNALLISSNYFKHLDNFSAVKNCAESEKSHVWIDGVGQWQHQGSKQHQIGYNDWTAGVSLGSDTSYKDFHFGGAVTYTYSSLNWKQSAGDGRINSYYGGLYGNWNNESLYVNFTTLGAYSHYNTSRHLHFGDLDRYAEASHHGWEALAGVEIGYYREIKRVRLGPFGRIDYVYLCQNSYTESGANSLNLQIKSRQDQLLQSQGGIVFTTNHLCGSEKTTGTITPRLELSYINQVPLAKSNYYTQFTDSSCEFSVSGWNFLRNLGAIGIGFTYLSHSERMGFSLQYDGQFGSHYWNQSGNLIFNIKY